ncbi:MAG TPA: hypothetical protein VIW70_00890 [Rubrivivax sp.]
MSKVASSALLVVLGRVLADLVGRRPSRPHDDEDDQVFNAVPGFGDTAFGQYRVERSSLMEHSSAAASSHPQALTPPPAPP